MTMFGSGMYLGKRTINCHPNPDYKLLGAVKSEFQVNFTPGSVGRPTEPWFKLAKVYESSDLNEKSVVFWQKILLG